MQISIIRDISFPLWPNTLKSGNILNR